ncbi:MAG: YbjQ family protein [Chloroflexi bacterium]|nr:MAG: YbjQ family protein [Chloroflexota bacterium]
MTPTAAGRRKAIYTQGVYEARELAMERMQAEAAAL